MALNFPSNPGDQAIYVDPSSGLKYIFNLAIGGWETAIQPPCIITLDGTAPDIDLEGFLWYDNLNQVLYIYRNGAWVPITGNTTGNVVVTVGPNPPPVSNQGDLWWDTVSGVLYIYYIDEDSQQWVVASPDDSGGGSSSNVFVGDAPPQNPKEGDMYFNELSQVLYVYTNGNWIATRTESASGVNQITVVDPIRDLGASEDPIIAIHDAAIDQKGAIRLATQSEVDLPELNTTQALTPSRLLVGIDAYLPQATESRKGVLAVATAEEVAAGTDDEKAITPATLSSFAQSNANPTGTVIAFAGETAPIGYLACNGQAITAGNNFVLNGKIVANDSDANTVEVDLTDLVGIVGTTVPDLRGEFVRGWSDDKVGVDDGRSIRSFQGDQFAEHNHSAPAGPAAVSGGQLGGGSRVSDSGLASTNNSGTGTETRPRNIALLYCIKY